MVTFLATRAPRFFSAELLTSWLPPASAGAWGCYSPGGGLCISHVQFHNVPVGPLLQPLKGPVHGGPALEFIDCSP